MHYAYCTCLSFICECMCYVLFCVYVLECANIVYLMTVLRMLESDCLLSFIEGAVHSRYSVIRNKELHNNIHIYQ